MRISRIMNSTHGLTLIELLIAMALGLTLAAGILQIFVWNYQLDLHQQAHSRMQENARFALNFIMQEIRMAAYPAYATVPQGIQGWEAGSAYDSTADSALVSSTGGHWSSQGSAVLPNFLAVPGSDMVQVWQQQAGNSDTITGVLFYVGKRGNLPGNPPALFQRRFSTASSPSAAEELVEGIASMQLLYGLTIGTSDPSATGAYVAADLINDWQQVNSVRMTLSMYSGLSQVSTREFSTTVALRNRVGGANVSSID